MDWRPVYAAATQNNIDLLERLENDGLSLSLADPVEGCTPLYSASWHGCLEAVNFLLQSEEGIQSLNKATVKGATPAYAAALQGHIEILKQLHSEGADLVAADKNGVSPLHAVVWHRRTQCLEYLLAQDDVLSAINACGSSGITALWVAVQRGDEEAIALLVGSGATFGGCPPSQVSREFVLPDHPPAVASSAQRGGREGLQRRASFGEQEGKAADEEEPPPQPVDPEELARAAAEGDMDVLLRFTALGENMDRRDEFGKTPLRLACESNQPKCVRFLVNRGANKEARDTAAGATPLHVAAQRGFPESVRVLLECGSDAASRRTEDGATPLWLACEIGCLETVAALLAHPGVDPDAPTNGGVRPIECACARNHSGVVDLLLGAGVTSFVDPGLWMGLRFGTWMMRRQLPEVLERQRLIVEQEAAEEAAFKAAEEEKRLAAKEAKEAEDKKNKKGGKAKAKAKPKKKK